MGGGTGRGPAAFVAEGLPAFLGDFARFAVIGFLLMRLAELASLADYGSENMDARYSSPAPNSGSSDHARHHKAR